MFFLPFLRQFVTVFKCNSISKHFSQFNLLHLPTYTCMQVSLISHVSRREFTFSLMLLVENENNVVEGWLPLIFFHGLFIILFSKFHLDQRSEQYSLGQARKINLILMRIPRIENSCYALIDICMQLS